jgi:hypothetical protein
MLGFRQVPKSQNLAKCFAAGIILLKFSLAGALGSSVTFVWAPNSENDIAGYKIYYGERGRSYTTQMKLGNVTSAKVTGLKTSATYYFFLTAYNTSGLESDFSDEVIYPVNSPPLAHAQQLTVFGGKSISIALTGSDPDGDSLSFSLSSNPTKGALSGPPPSLLYTPNSGATGRDSFTYTVSDGEAVSVPATVTIILKPMPSVRLTAPRNGRQFRSPVEITLSATVIDNDGGISSVDFFNGTSFLGTGTAPAYKLSWESVQPGSYLVTARASSLLGFTYSSSPAAITVIPKPTGSPLLGYWAFDDATGPAAVDSSDYQNDGTLLGGATWVQGKFGGALGLDGVDDYVHISPSIANIIPSTVSAWFKTSSSKPQVIYSEGSSQSDQSFLRLTLNSPTVGMIGFEERDDDRSANSQSVQVNSNDGLWHGVALVRVSPEARRLYFDGKLVGLLVGRNSGLTDMDRAAIGASSGLGTGSYFGGSIDDLRLYDRALEEEEIQLLFPTSAASKENNLPIISELPDVSFLENSFITTIGFTIDDLETPAEFLAVDANCSNPSLIPRENIFLFGEGANQRMALLSKPNQSGAATVTVSVSDTIGVTSRSFLVTVVPR